MSARLLMLPLLLVVAAPVAALDLPAAGRSLSLEAEPGDTGRRRAKILLRDPSIAVPFPDLASTGATLRIDGGPDPGQCSASIELPAEGWRALGGDGALRGYRYHDPEGASGGVVGLLVLPGLIEVRAGGQAFPCGMTAAQLAPVEVVLEAGADRYCAAFGGRVLRNEPGSFRAQHAPAPDSCPDVAVPVSAASLNILHGLSCSEGSFCRFDDRLALLLQWIEDAGCPDAVTLQEVSVAGEPLIRAALPGLCGGVYQAAYLGGNFFDDELHLVRHPLLLVEEVQLQKNFRTVLFTRQDHPLGPLDVFSTHLASGADRGDSRCGADCPAACVAAGAATVRDCQAVQLALYVESRHDVSGPALVTGDFNEVPGSFVYQQFAGRGWLDVYLEAGLPECDPISGVGCTSGRQDEDLSELESPASNQRQRIDFLFLVPPTAGACTVDPAGTRIFADDPNPFAPACGPAPLPICWPSDHEGMQVRLDCP